MKERGIDFISRTFGILRNYKLVFNKLSSKNSKEGFANIITCQDSIVEGAIYEINDSDIFLLDKYEGIPKHYYRKNIEVQNNNGMVNCIVYISNESKIIEGLKPSEDYLNHILKGKDLFTENYYNKLRNTELLKR
jgi:gamma-glutamylcyclotransferase (GGCT)/AIG2-like uncharacterized protein YtfP